MNEETVVQQGTNPILWLLLAVAIGALGVFIAIKFGKWDWKKALARDAFSWIKLIGYGLAILEVLVLSDNAINRGVSALAAYGRYTGVALVAIVFGLMLTSAFDQGIENRYKDDNIITLKELLLLMIPVSLIFICTVIVANTTFVIYLESIGKMELLIGKISLVDMIWGVNMEGDPDKFVYAKGAEVQPEMTAYVLTYADVFVNLASIMYAVFVEHWKKIHIFHPCNPMGGVMEKVRGTSIVLEEAKQKYYEQKIAIEKLQVETQLKQSKAAAEIKAIKEKAKVDLDKTKNDPEKAKDKDRIKFEGANTEIKYYYPMMKDVFNIGETEFENFLNERCGYDPVTGAKKDYADTLPSVKSGTLDPVDARDSTIKGLINNDGQLRALSDKFKAVEEFLNDKMFPVKTQIDALVKRNADADDIKRKKAELSTYLTEFKDTLHKAYNKAWDKTFNYMKNTLKVKLASLDKAKDDELYKYKSQLQELEDACK